MSKIKQKTTPSQRRAFRTRGKITRVNILRNPKRDVRPRLSVHRTGNNIYAQIIDDLKGVTLASASTLSGEKSNGGASVDAATKVGKEIAANAKKAGIKKVVFDRGRFLYHGRVKALADGAREGGLEF